jgi:beta-glucanase (GH16 family)
MIHRIALAAAVAAIGLPTPIAAQLTTADTTSIVRALTAAALSWIDRAPGNAATVTFDPAPESEPWISLVAAAMESTAPTRVERQPTWRTPRLAVWRRRADNDAITFDITTRLCYEGTRLSSYGNGHDVTIERFGGEWRERRDTTGRGFHCDVICTQIGDADPSAADPRAPAQRPGHRLIWHDEFNADGPPDTASWIPETGFVRNRELQWYQLANAHQAAGVLVLEGRRERVTNPQHDPAAPADDWKRARPFADYTSASIKTMGRHAWTFGRFEMRGRIDIRSGLWPAFWTVGSGSPSARARPWPANGEIDIMEYYNGILLGNAAWASERPGVALWDDVKIPIDSIAMRAGYASAADWAADFHVWRMDWDADWIRHYVDDRLVNEIPITNVRNQTADGANPFHEPHHILLNLAIGATGGDPSATPFPVRFEVDWVRVYQRIAPRPPARD